MKTMTEQLRERWEAIEAERNKAVGPNPKVVASFSFPIADLGVHAQLSSAELFAKAEK